MTQPTRIHRLRCGAPLLLLPNPEVAVATADVWVATGAAHEPAPVAGISHFLEHMLFKGTEKWGLGEIERAIESVGGVCNAGTSHDFTHYYLTMPSAAIGTGLEMLAEMVRHSTLDAEELEKERLVILEEYRRKQDHPTGVLYERLYAELFESGPYHDPVIGFEETIRAIDRPAMVDYFHKRYSPQNMALVVTGSYDEAAIIEQAESAFGGFERPLVELKAPAERRFGRNKCVHVTKPTGGEVYVAFAFPAPGMSQVEDVLPLDMAQFILGQGRASRLYQELKERRQLCSSISSYYPTHAGDSMFVVAATCQPAQRAGLRAALMEELERFAAAEPTEDQMRRALRLQASAHRFSMETSGGASSNVGYYYTLSGDVEFLDGYLERLGRVTSAEVRRATAAVLGAGDGPMAERVVEVAVGPEE